MWQVIRSVGGRMRKKPVQGSETLNNVRAQTGFFFKDRGISVPGGTLKGRRRKLGAIPRRASQSIRL
jgi:hypothetical protein